MITLMVTRANGRAPCLLPPQSCLNACNKRGTCVAGFCHCKPGAHRGRLTGSGTAAHKPAGTQQYTSPPAAHHPALPPTAPPRRGWITLSLLHPSLPGPPLTAGHYGADCALSLALPAPEPGGGSELPHRPALRPTLLAGSGYSTRTKRPHVYVYELPPRLTSWINMRRLDRPTHNLFTQVCELRVYNNLPSDPKPVLLGVCGAQSHGAIWSCSEHPQSKRLYGLARSSDTCQPGRVLCGSGSGHHLLMPECPLAQHDACPLSLAAQRLLSSGARTADGDAADWYFIPVRGEGRATDWPLGEGGGSFAESGCAPLRLSSLPSGGDVSSSCRFVTVDL